MIISPHKDQPAHRAGDKTDAANETQPDANSDTGGASASSAGV